MDKLILKCGKEEHHLFTNEILYLEADGRYTKIYTITKNLLMCTNIGHYDGILPSPPFIRVHHRYLINIGHITVIKNSRIILSNDIEIPLAQRRKKIIKELLKLWGNVEI